MEQALQGTNVSADMLPEEVIMDLYRISGRKEFHLFRTHWFSAVAVYVRNSLPGHQVFPWVVRPW